MDMNLPPLPARVHISEHESGYVIYGYTDKQMQEYACAAMAQAGAEPSATELLGAVARGWCHELNARKTMDSDLAIAIAAEVSALYAPTAQPAPMPKFNTSESGRAEVARFFRQHLRRHDFERYISEKLAADFACALAPSLHSIMAAAPAFTTQQEQAQAEAAAYSRGHDAGWESCKAYKESLPVASAPLTTITDEGKTRLKLVLKALSDYPYDDRHYHEAVVPALNALDALEAPLPAREPLTDALLRRIHHEAQFGLFCDYDEFEQITREIEGRHNITATPAAKEQP